MIMSAIQRPRWRWSWYWWGFLTAPPLEFASFGSTCGTVGEFLDSAMYPSINFEDLEVIRAMWPGKIAIDRLQNFEDSRHLVGLGVDGVLPSNNGGRQS